MWQSSAQAGPCSWQATPRQPLPSVLVPPTKGQRAAMSAILHKIIAEWRNRIETTFKEITDQMQLARHGGILTADLADQSAPGAAAPLPVLGRRRSLRSGSAYHRHSSMTKIAWL